MATYKKYATKDGTPIQVQSAIEDGQGRQIDETYVEHNSYDGTLSVGYSDSTGAIKTDYGVELNAGATIDGHLDEPFLFRPTAYPFNRDIITIGGQKATVKEVRAYAFVKNQKIHSMRESNTSHGITFTRSEDLHTVHAEGINTEGSQAYHAIAGGLANSIFIANHKYLMLTGQTQLQCYFNIGGMGSAGYQKIYTYNGTALPSGPQAIVIIPPNVTINTDITLQLIDLTQWFNNDTTILSKTNETWFVPWFLNNFGKYMPTYSTGEIENTYATQITTNGVNQWDGTNDIRVLPKTQYYCKGSATLTYKDIDGNTIDTATVSDAVFTTPDNCIYVGVSGSGNIQICLHWTETEIEQSYHPYEKWIFNIDWSAIGTPLGINSQIGDYKDFVNGKNGKVVGSIDLGTLNYTLSGLNFVSNIISDIKIPATVETVANIICSLYNAVSIAKTFVELDIAINPEGRLYIRNTAYNDAATFKAAMSGVILQYELAEPTLTDMPESEKLTNTYNVNDYGTEEFDNVCALDVLYQNNLVRQIVNNQTAIADHEQKIGALETEVEGITGLPTAPSTNGNYRLRCTVADAVETYTWVAENANPIMHANIFRGKNLGTAVTNEQKTAIQNGTFEDLFVGDYWVINGITWRIADMDYFYQVGDTAFTKHHLVMIPDENLYSYVMNDSATTEGGYVGSKMYTTGLEQAKTAINSAFGSLVQTHRDYLINATIDGRPSGVAWFDSTVELMNEVMVYGCYIKTTMGTGVILPANHTTAKKQLSIFRLNPKMLNRRKYIWLRDIVSSFAFALVVSNGVANAAGANSSAGVLPYFVIG